jgi:hypothetical protein
MRTPVALLTLVYLALSVQAFSPGYSPRSATFAVKNTSLNAAKSKLPSAARKKELQSQVDSAGLVKAFVRIISISTRGCVLAAVYADSKIVLIAVSHVLSVERHIWEPVLFPWVYF